MLIWLSTAARSSTFVRRKLSHDGGMSTASRFRNPRPPTPVPATLADAVSSGVPFSSGEALSAGLVTRYELRSKFRAILPGVYAAKGRPLSRWEGIRAVGIWAPADAVIGGWAAAYLHGEHWYSTEKNRGIIDVLTLTEPRPPRGIRERMLRQPIPDSDVCVIGGVRITSPARTTVDVARWAVGNDLKVCMIDSMCFASDTALDDVAAAAARMPGQHGVSNVVRLLESCDAGAHSPQESLLRLGIARSPLPQPTSQYEIRERNGDLISVADLAYISEKVAIFYDGKHHGEAKQWRRDLRITARLTDLGWQVVRISKDMHPNEIMRHIENALARGHRNRRT